MREITRMEQHFAVSKDGVLAHIKDAHNNLEDYYCPYCHCRMLKKCGNIRTWHFAHDWRYADEFQKSCSYETYLHGYAKLRFKQWFDESDSIKLYYSESIVCKQYNHCKLLDKENCLINRKKSCDLKKYFDHCIIEAPIKESNGSYRADLLLTSDRKPDQRILLEIKVSHGCTERKKII